MNENDLSTAILLNHSTEMPDSTTIVGSIDNEDDWSYETLAQTRYIIQRIIVPCVVTIGIAGNLLTVIVLTRRRMRCSTNIYLTALAIADIVNLFFAFILSLQRYPNYNYGHGFYWSTIGLSHWFHDASLYTSIYLTVSFTLERYISVCHPLRGQVLCTESRAKKVITAVVILCFLCTITTRFEYDLKSSVAYFDYSSGAPCTESQANNKTYGGSCKYTHLYSVSPSNFSLSKSYQNFFYYPSTLFGTLIPFILLSVLNGFLIWTVRKSHQMRHTMTNTRQTDTSQENKVTITLIAVVILFLICQSPNALQLLRIMDLDYHRNRDLVLNNIFNLLISINAASNFILYCVLSDKYRKTVKLIFCGARPMRRGTYSSSRFTSGRTASSFYSRSHNSNFFNVPIYRQREPRFSVSKEEYASLQTESAKPPRFSITTVTPSRTSSVAEADLPEEIQMCPTGVSKGDKNRMKNIRFTFAPTNSNSKNFSKSDTMPVIKADDSSISDGTEQNALLEPLSSTNNNNHAHAHTNTCLQPSPSETSLTRSRSLNLPNKTKHSPDCKDNPYKL